MTQGWNIASSAWWRWWLHNQAVDYRLLFLMVLPNLIWILLDRGKWISDTSLYAMNPRAITTQCCLTRQTGGALFRDPPPLPSEGDHFDTWLAVIQGTAEISNQVRESANFERMATPDSWDVEIYRDVGGT